MTPPAPRSGSFREGRVRLACLLAWLLCPAIVGAPSAATAQDRSSARDAGQPSLPSPMLGVALGGPGRRTLGGDGAVRIEDRARPAAPPTPAPALKSSFRALADAFDRATDPR